MVEAEAVLARDLRGVGCDQPLAYECGQTRHHLSVVWAHRLDGPAVEQLTLHGAALEDAALLCRQHLEPRRKQRLQRRRHPYLVPGCRRHREHLLDEQRNSRLLHGRCDRRAPEGPGADQVAHVVGREHLEAERDRPGGSPVGQLGAA